MKNSVLEMLCMSMLETQELAAEQLPYIVMHLYVYARHARQNLLE